MKAMNDIVQLLKIETTEGVDGFKYPISTSSSEVFASVQSVKRTEFYSALNEGRKAEKTLTLWVDDFKAFKPDKIMHEEIIYEIIREWQDGEMLVELTLEKV